MNSTGVLDVQLDELESIAAALRLQGGEIALRARLSSNSRAPRSTLAGPRVNIR
jgi:hypothetical protein